MFIDNKDFQTMAGKWLQVFDHLSIGAFLTKDKKVVQVNRSAMMLMGIEGNIALNQTCQKLCCSIPCHGRCPFQGEPDRDNECPNVEIIDGRGAKHMVTRFVVPLYSPEREIQGCFTVLQDHSALSGLIQRVEHQERTLKMIFDSIETGIFTVNKGGHVTFFNRAAEKISGYTRRQVLGKNCLNIFTGDSNIGDTLLKKTIQQGDSLMNQGGRITGLDGEIIPVQTSFIPLKNEKDLIVGGLATLQDLTLASQVRQVIEKQYRFNDMIGRDPAMQTIFEKASVAAVTDATILIEGNTGTGKDLMARVLHSASRRADQPFVKVNCAAIPNHLLESEMFGYVKGAFTGANTDKPGRFHEANNGTIFLDEIGDIPFELQAKLLRVLEDKEFYPLGSRHTQKVDVRIVSATNLGLEKLVGEKKFRQDLYYRLNVLRIVLPDLADRKADLPLLVRHILRKLCVIKGYEFPGIDEAAMSILLNYRYPGNVRELENILEHALIVCQDKIISPAHLPAHMQQWQAPDGSAGGSMQNGSRENFEAGQILETLERFNGNRNQTARALGMDRTTLWRKMKRLDISYPSPTRH